MGIAALTQFMLRGTRNGRYMWCGRDASNINSSAGGHRGQLQGVIYFLFLVGAWLEVMAVEWFRNSQDRDPTQYIQSKTWENTTVLLLFWAGAVLGIAVGFMAYVHRKKTVLQLLALPLDCIRMIIGVCCGCFGVSYHALPDSATGGKKEDRSLESIFNIARITQALPHYLVVFIMLSPASDQRSPATAAIAYITVAVVLDLVATLFDQLIRPDKSNSFGVAVWMHLLVVSLAVIADIGAIYYATWVLTLRPCGNTFTFSHSTLV
jgi:hypothetical protein